MKGFYRMCDQYGWDRDDKERKEANEALRAAMVHEFNASYDTDANDINSWHKLCLALDISPPKGLQACREVSLCNYLVLKYCFEISIDKEYSRKSTVYT